MDISVVIVSWKVKDLLKQCLQSIFDLTRGVKFEVFVVDNNSGDGTAEMVAQEFPQVNLIASNRNLGFAKGNNIAIEIAQGDIVYLLNPDTELKDNAIAKLVDFMRCQPQAGIVGTKLVNPDGSHQLSVRRLPGFLVALLWVLKLHKLFPGWRLFRDYLADDFDYSKSQQCEQVMGASMAIRRSVLENLGVLDEQYFIWFEEVDYCKMATDAGHQVWYTPEATITHYGGVSFGQVNGLTNQRRFNSSLRKYVRKHHGYFAWLLLLLFHPFSMFLAWMISLKRDKI